jgi:crossover junction endodeoxyribonuclease RuvC
MFLWIDPGVRKLWYALVDERLQIVDASIIVQEREQPTREDWFVRMSQMNDFFVELLQKHHIKAAAIEKLFFTSFNQNNAEFVYGLRGMLMVLLHKHHIPVYEYSPIELKKNITGNGKAGKKLIQTRIQSIYKLTHFPQFDDAADALGLAYLAARKTKS